jgi:hypothetical protein
VRSACRSSAPVSTLNCAHAGLFVIRTREVIVVRCDRREQYACPTCTVAAGMPLISGARFVVVVGTAIAVRRQYAVGSVVGFSSTASQRGSSGAA